VIVFEVTLWLKDNSTDKYNVVARDDASAREGAERLLRTEWKGFDKDFPGVLFAEVRLVCIVDMIVHDTARRTRRAAPAA
jgi:hypothetical protein